MSKVTKVYQSDFEKVYELIQIFFPNTLKETWRRLFMDLWERPEDYFGYAIVDGSNVVGFIATIFSQREVNGKRYKFCNLSTWVVRKEYRNESIALIFPILKLKDHTVTNFSAIPGANQILRKIGFKSLANYRKMIIPVPSIKSIICGGCELVSGEEVTKILNDDDLKIYNDHSQFACEHLVINSGDAYTYIIMRKRTKKVFNLSFAIGDIYYISHKKVFLMYFDNIKYYCAQKFRLSAIMIIDTYVPEYQSLFSLNRPGEGLLYRSGQLTPSDIDSLYSENFLLNF